VFKELLSLTAVLIALHVAPYSRAAGDTPWALSLESAQAIARQQNYDLKISLINVSRSQANVDIAQAPPNPVVSLSTSGVRMGNNGSGSIWNKRVDSVVHVDQLIERGGKRELRTENARQQLRAARYDSNEVERQVSLLVAYAYIDLKTAQDKYAGAVDTAQLLDAIFQAVRLRQSAGDVAGADVERVKVDLLRARNEVDAASAEVLRSRRALGLLLGASEAVDTLQASDPWPSIEVADMIQSTSVTDAINQRADVRASAARLQASDSAFQYANSLRVRDVSIGMQYEHYPQPGDASAGNGSSVGFSIQFPLFVRYYYKGEILAADAARGAAEEDLKRSRTVAEYDIVNAQSALVNAAERVRRNRDELLKAAEKAARSAEFAYQNGAIGVMDVLDARRTLKATRLDALAAQAEFSKAMAAWSAAIAITSEETE
jgi:cobalt-zinc-cadmium efflux system outer membrane protein